MPRENRFRVWFREWFGPTWLQDIVWPVIALPVYVVIAAIVLWWISGGITPEP